MSFFSQPDMAEQIGSSVPPATVDELRVIAQDPTLTYTAARDAVNTILAPYDIVVTDTDIELYRDLRYAEYFLNSKTSVAQLDTIEISHSAFSQTYRIVRNSVQGLTAKIETGATAIFEYYPIKIVPHHARDDLDHSITITFGDLGEIIPLELDNVMNAPGGFDEKPVVKYRIYRSDDLEAPLYGPLLLEVDSFTFDRYGSTFEAKAPSVNLNRTGESYTLTRFPGMRGFL